MLGPVSPAVRFGRLEIPKEIRQQYPNLSETMDEVKDEYFNRQGIEALEKAHYDVVLDWGSPGLRLFLQEKMTGYRPLDVKMDDPFGFCDLQFTHDGMDGHDMYRLGQEKLQELCAKALPHAVNNARKSVLSQFENLVNIVKKGQ